MPRINVKETIEYFRYRTIEKGFYEVHGATTDGKIFIEGNVCGGLLLELLERTKKDKGKIVRERGKAPSWQHEAVEKLKMRRK